MGERVQVTLSRQRSTIIAILAALAGALLLIASQMTAESLSRAGAYPVDEDLILLLPLEEGGDLANAVHVTPNYTPVPAYVYDGDGPETPGTFETRFEWNSGDPQPALLLAFYRRVDAITLNGNPVALQNLRQISLVGAWRPASVLLEEDHLVDGTNVLQITDPGTSRRVLPAFAIVPAEEAQRAAFAGEFFELHLPLAVTGIMLFVALFCAAITWQKSEKLEIRCFIALLLVWSLRNLMGFDLFGDLPSPWRVFVAYWIGYVLAAAFAAYCFAWANRGALWVTVCWGIAAAAIALTLALGYESGQAAFEISYLVESWLIPGFVLAGILAAISAEAKTGAGRAIQLLLIAGAGSALALDAFDERFDVALGLLDPQPMIYYSTPRHGILLALGVLGAMIYHQVRARRLSEDLNGELNRLLTARESELADAHTREKVLVREQAFSEERRRIMRDMHDGLGSQLMGMLLAARRGKAEPDKVAEGLQQVIDELRLMIDSMESVGDSLATAITSFRARLQSRIEDAGFAFDWDNQLGGNIPSYPPRKTLQLFRIIQEAVTNALKHSGGDRIGISFARVASEQADLDAILEVCVTDNGQGISGPRLGGHGLENIRARAAREGGDVHFASPDENVGGLVRVRFPITADQES